MKTHGKQIKDKSILQDQLELTSPLTNSDAATMDYVLMNISKERYSTSNKNMKVGTNLPILNSYVEIDIDSIGDLKQPQSTVEVFINTVKVDVGPSYSFQFRNSDNTIIRNIGETKKGDYLYVNTDMLGYEITTDDIFDFNYIIPEFSSSDTTYSLVGEILSYTATSETQGVDFILLDSGGVKNTNIDFNTGYLTGAPKSFTSSNTLILSNANVFGQSDPFNLTWIVTDTLLMFNTLPEHGTMQYQNSSGNWIDVLEDYNYDYNMNFRFVPDTVTLTPLVKDINIGTFDSSAELSDWGTVSPGIDEITYTAPGGVTISTIISSGTFGVYNGVGTSLGVGIGKYGENGIQGSEYIRLEIEGEDINEITIVIDGIGSLFLETATNATQVVIEGYNSSDVLLDTQSAYKSDNSFSDTFSFTGENIISYFIIKTDAVNPNADMVLTNAVLSKSVNDSFIITTGTSGGSATQSIDFSITEGNVGSNNYNLIP